MTMHACSPQLWLTGSPFHNVWQCTVWSLHSTLPHASHPLCSAAILQALLPHSRSVLVSASTIQGEKELQVSFFQALVLLLFDDVDRLSFTDISQATNIGTTCH